VAKDALYRKLLHKWPHDGRDEKQGGWIVRESPVGAVMFIVRDELAILSPTAVTAITTDDHAGSFAISNGENSEVIIFRLS
jgi:hypothetical protein